MFGGTADYQLVEKDTLTTLQVTCKRADTGAVIDLTGITPTLKYKIGGGTLVSRTMTVTTATMGLCTYQFVTNELTPGIMVAEVELLSGGKVVSSLEVARLTIRAKLT